VAPVIAVGAGLVLLAALTRVTAILWPEAYLSHLSYAALVWLAGLAAWGWTVFGKGQLLRRLR
jgi:hypothetical protein